MFLPFWVVLRAVELVALELVLQLVLSVSEVLEVRLVLQVLVPVTPPEVVLALHHTL